MWTCEELLDGQLGNLQSCSVDVFADLCGFGIGAKKASGTHQGGKPLKDSPSKGLSCVAKPHTDTHTTTDPSLKLQKVDCGHT